MNAPRVTASLPAITESINEHWPMLSTLPTTQLRIVVDLGLAVIFVLGCMIADMIGKPIDQGTQITVGTFIASMLGIGAVQFVQKRKTSFAPSATVTTSDETGTTTATATQGTAESGTAVRVQAAPSAASASVQAAREPDDDLQPNISPTVVARDEADGIEPTP